ncbi:hypothetical protein HBI10_162900, partial [Parastagonospora nodorum]
KKKKKKKTTYINLPRPALLSPSDNRIQHPNNSTNPCAKITVRKYRCDRLIHPHPPSKLPTHPTTRIADLLPARSSLPVPIPPITVLPHHNQPTLPVLRQLKQVVQPEPVFI